MDQTRWLVVVALLAIISVSVVFVETYESVQVSHSLSVKLLINLWNRYANASQQVKFLSDIGAPGGIFATTRYSSDGVNGFYPVWGRHYGNTVFVDSRVYRNYTLGDFFEVWGEPLGPLNTLGAHENASSYHGNITETTYLFIWSMCLQNPHSPGGPVYSVNEWGSHVLRDNETITLTYATEACGLPGGQQA